MVEFVEEMDGFSLQGLGCRVLKHLVPCLSVGNARVAIGGASAQRAGNA